MYYLNENIKNLERIFDQNERRDYLRLDLNENPGGLPQEFIDEVLKEVTPGLISQYPETKTFTDVLARHLECDSSNICLTNGSAEAIRYVIQAFSSINGRIICVSPTYFMFQVYSLMYGRKFIKIPYDENLKMDVNNIINELTDDTELCILLNPNNPVGNVYTEDEFRKIFEICQKKQITMLIDEAYHYFYPKTFIEYALKNKRVFITRTFSKLFSLAGCRLGYVVGNEEDIKYVQKFCTPHNTNAFAMLFAEKILEKPGMLELMISKFEFGRNYLIDSLDKYNYMHIGEAGNFIFIKPKTNAEKIVKRMKEDKRILIKSYKNIGEFGDCLMVSIGEKQYMKIFIDALLELDK